MFYQYLPGLWWANWIFCGYLILQFYPTCKIHENLTCKKICFTVYGGLCVALSANAKCVRLICSAGRNPIWWLIWFCNSLCWSVIISPTSVAYCCFYYLLRMVQFSKFIFFVKVHVYALHLCINVSVLYFSGIPMDSYLLRWSDNSYLELAVS